MITDYLIPCLLLLCACVGLRKKENVYDAMAAGGAEGLKLLLTIIPSLVVLLCAIEMLRASGGLELLTDLLSPFCGRIGLPPETLPLMLVRPFSGSAALAVGAELMAHYGVDSQIGRTAAVMLGSTETTFYTITVYFGAAGVKNTRHSLLAALAADLTGFFCAALFTRML
jgi:spore maturation protein B